MRSTPEQLAIVVPLDRPQPTPRGYRSLLRILLAAEAHKTETEEAA